MKFKCSIEINLPQTAVFNLYSDIKYLDKWQSGFESKVPLSGQTGTIGSKAKLTYSGNKDRIELIETILAYEKPNLIDALYEHKHMVNTMKSHFIVLDPDKTLIEVEIHYIKFNGFIPKLMSLITPGFFKKQVQNNLNNFRLFTHKIIISGL
jgi:hypothetical protein